MENICKIIVIDGLDGAGKHTQAKKLEKYISEVLKKEVALISFPQYEEPSSYLVKRYLKNEFNHIDSSEIKPETTQLFYSVDFAVAHETHIKDYMKEKDYLILDRYVSSNYLYHTLHCETGQEILDHIEWIDKLNYEVLRLPMPHQTIFLDVLPEVSLSNIEFRGDDDNDILQREGRIREVYKYSQYISNKLNWDIIQCCFDDSKEMKPREMIFDEIIQKI